MFSSIRTRKTLREQLSPCRDKNTGDDSGEEMVGYNFLRNTWGTYFFDRNEISSEDKIDRINKIVGMMKGQVKVMISHESNLIDRHINSIGLSEDPYQNFKFSLTEHQKIRESLQRSKMREQQLQTLLHDKQKSIQQFERQNHKLKMQLSELKHQKNRSQEKVIMLSNKIYELDREKHRNDQYFRNDHLNKLERHSAVSIEPLNESFSSKEPHFIKKQLISLQTLHDEIQSQQQEDNQQVQFSELNLNFSMRLKNPLKHSLQLYDKQSSKFQGNFLDEMKKMKLKTQRMVEMQNEKNISREVRRRTMTAASQIFHADIKQVDHSNRRFQRIRC